MRVSYNKTNFVVGRSAKENWDIISKADKDYYWVHAEGIPSAHIIIEIDEPVIEEFDYACKLCISQTKIKKSSVKFITTQVKNVKLGDKPGQVYLKDRSKAQIITLDT